jgi:hypothetical protein
MNTSTLGAFRYAGIAALPLCLALALGTGVTAADHSCVAEAPITLDGVPSLGKLTVTGTRLDVTPPDVRSAADRSDAAEPHVKPTRARYPSVL